MRQELSESGAHRVPRVSIITVTYNAEALIARTIESVIALNYPSIEYIVIDGGSKDRTVDIASRYREHIGYLLSEPDHGIYDAMNKGLERATGDYVWFLNAGDCIASPDCLDDLKHLAPPPGYLYSDTFLVDSTGSSVGRTFSPDALRPKHVELGSAVCHQSFVPRREFVSPYDTRLNYVADQKWILQVLSRTSQGRKVATPLASYLLGGLSQRRFLSCLGEKIRYSFAELGLAVALRVCLAAPYHVLRFFGGTLLRNLTGGAR